MSKMSEVIYKSEDYYVTIHHPLEVFNNVIVVAFDIIFGSYSEKGFGVDFCLANNIPIIFVSHKDETFFQGLSKKKLAEVLEPYLAEKDVVTYGSSLGGYAAIYYADALNARAFAISPRCSVDPGFKKVFPGDRFKVEFKHSEIKAEKCSKYHFFAYDPFNERDHFYLNNIITPSISCDYKILELPFTSHPSAPFLNNKVSILKSLALGFFGNKDIGELDFILPQEEQNLFYLGLDFNFLLQKAKKSFEKHDWEEAASYLYVPLLVQGNKNGDAVFILAYSLLKINRIKELREVYGLAKKEDYERPALAISIAEKYMANKEYTDAALVWNCIINIYSKFPSGVYVRLASAYVSVGEYMQAEKWLQHCLDLDSSFSPALDLIDRVKSLQAKKFLVRVNRVQKNNRLFHFESKFNGQIVRQRDLDALTLMAWSEIRKGENISFLVKNNEKIKCFKFETARPDVINHLMAKLKVAKEDLVERCGVRVTTNLRDGSKIGVLIDGEEQWTHEISLVPVVELVHGKDNWLFLANDHNRSVDQFSGKLLLGEKDKKKWEDYIKEVKVVSENFHTISVIANSKEKVLPDLYPYEKSSITITNQVEEIYSYFGLELVNPIVRNFNNKLAYYKTDTHWSDLGSFNAFSLCMEKLGYNVSFDRFFTFKSRQVIGDLGSKLTPPVSSEKMVYSLRSKLGAVTCVFNNKIKGTGNIKIYVNNDSFYNEKIVMFGGSSLDSGNFARYFSYFFARVVVVNLPGHIVMQIIEHEKPSHLILQTNERYLVAPGKIHSTMAESPICSKIRSMKESELKECAAYLQGDCFNEPFYRDFFLKLIESKF
ncbi:MAG: hypothetical protein ACQEUK_03240 [Pseudomonadota bacterium]